MTQTEKVEFPGSAGAPLTARLDLPGEKTRAYALFANFFTRDRDAAASARIAHALTESGIAVLRFDSAGPGGPGDDFGDTGFAFTVEDLVRAADHLRTHFAAPSILIGHSLGGAAVLAARQRIPEVRAVATIATPADPARVPRSCGENAAESERRGQAEVVLNGRTFRVHRRLLDEIAAQPQAERVAGLGAALLVMHSPIDELVGIDNARRIFDAARHPKSFVALDGADHLLTEPADAEYVAHIVGAWATRYAIGPAGDREPPAEGRVEVSETGDSRLAQRIKAGHHILTADEPVPAGVDSGPSPYDLLLAALGACTSMTVRIYAERKRWPLDRVTVRLEHSRVHATDCAQGESHAGTLDHIDRSIRFEGDLDDDQRRRLLEIAEKCPVHRTLVSKVEIETTEAAG